MRDRNVEAEESDSHVTPRVELRAGGLEVELGVARTLEEDGSARDDPRAYLSIARSIVHPRVGPCDEIQSDVEFTPEEVDQLIEGLVQVRAELS